MLLTSVVFVMREVLEAALILSLLLAAAQFLRLHRHWLAVALTAGLLGSAVYALNMGAITDLLDGVGQEVVDAFLQYCVFATVAVTIFLIIRRFRYPARAAHALPVFMAATVALALAREGSEIIIYLTGFWQLADFVSTIGLGSLVGASIGLSVGVLFYYLLLSQPARRALPLATLLLALIGCGLCMQATGLLIQADWITSAGPLWNTADSLPESSLLGQLLYALVGYEASPSAEQVASYVASLLIMVTSAVLAVAANRGHSTAK